MTNKIASHLAVSCIHRMSCHAQIPSMPMIAALLIAVPSCGGGNPSHAGEQPDSGTGEHERPECTDISHCPPTGSECLVRTCMDEKCGTQPVASGTPITPQTTGDCKVQVCDGKGKVVSVDDDNDLPQDGNPCTNAICTSGVPSNPPLPSGTECLSGGLCDGGSVCVNAECAKTSDCPAATACRWYECLAGTCEVFHASEGGLAANQITGDCKKNVCDGAGNTKSVDDNSDVPRGGWPCIVGHCENGVASQTSSPIGTACGTSLACDGEGDCAGCESASSCPGKDNDCQTRTCVAGICGFMYAPAGTAAAGHPDPGHCLKNVCDGVGGVETDRDDGNVSTDGFPCVVWKCGNAGLEQSFAAEGTPCGTAQTCNGKGECGPCATPTFCPGEDTPCQTRTCVDGVCGMHVKQAGDFSWGGDGVSCYYVWCDGIGAVPDPAWQPPNLACRIYGCDKGLAYEKFAERGKSCGTRMVCDDKGDCVPASPLVIKAGLTETCGINGAGTLRCWGSNANGVLGNGTGLDSHVPTLVTGFATGAVTVWTGERHACALNAAGELWCWGNNTFGQLGDGTTTHRATPIKVLFPPGVTKYAAHAMGANHTCAWTYDGIAYCWGNNSAGQLGNGTTTDVPFPVEVDRPTGVADQFASMSAGQSHTCAVTWAQKVVCWGSNALGQLGVGTNTDSTSPMLVGAISGTPQATVSGNNHTCARSSFGTVWCWGDNLFGQLGDRSNTNRNMPVQAYLLSGVKFTAAGGSQTCAVTTTGQAYCWGRNQLGQLGDGTKTDRHEPWPVASPGVGFSQISVGSGHTCGLTLSDDAMCWGDNAQGQLGTGDTIGSVAPIPVIGFP